MLEVTPKIYLLAETKLCTRADEGDPNTHDWLDEVGGSGVWSHLTGSDPEYVIELAARRCYKSFVPGLNPNVTKVREDSRDYHKNILSSRHGRVLEHATCTFAFEYVSRVFTHELVRHCAGATYAQESLRYVRLTNLGFRIPKCIADNPDALEVFRSTVALLESKQLQLAHVFQLDDMKGQGSFEQKKVLTSAFRRIAPLGLATGIVATFNFRALRWLIEVRTQLGAEEEIREVIGKVAEIAVKRWPYVFGDFTKTEKGEWIPTYSKV